MGKADLNFYLLTSSAWDTSVSNTIFLYCQCKYSGHVLTHQQLILSGYVFFISYGQVSTSVTRLNLASPSMKRTIWDKMWIMAFSLYHSDLMNINVSSLLGTQPSIKWECKSQMWVRGKGGIALVLLILIKKPSIHFKEVRGYDAIPWWPLLYQPFSLYFFPISW